MPEMMRPRLISKEQARLVASAGGRVGVWTHLADTPKDYAGNIRALVDVIGGRSRVYRHGFLKLSTHQLTLSSRAERKMLGTPAKRIRHELKGRRKRHDSGPSCFEGSRIRSIRKVITFDKALGRVPGVRRLK